MSWSKLLSRDDVDLITISGVDVVFFDLIWEFSKTKKELFFTHFYGNTFTHYIGVNSKELGRSLYKKYFNSSDIIKKYRKEGIVLLSQAKKSTNEWKRKLEKNSDKSLFLLAYNDFFSQFMKIVYTYSITSWLAIEAWQHDFEQLLSSMIKRNKLENKQEQILCSAYKPWKKTAIIEIQDKIRKGEKIKKIVEDYQFLRSWSLVWYVPIDRGWVKNIGQVPSDYRKKNLSLGGLARLLKPNREEKHFLKLAPYLIFFKDWRDDIRRRHTYLWSFFFHLIAERFNVDYKDIGYLTLKEIENCLRLNKFDSKIVNERKNKPCIITADLPHLRMKVIDKGISKYEKVMKQIENQENAPIIKGIVAQKGKAKGRVLIIRSYHDIKKVKDGDILIANTTHPNYLPGMRKAAAFVTNEGGQLSHAAIVAREMGKPCIVGTKVATKVLSDDDFVEVDADNGIVRKL